MCSVWIFSRWAMTTIVSWSSWMAARIGSLVRGPSIIVARSQEVVPNW